MPIIVLSDAETLGIDPTVVATMVLGRAPTRDEMIVCFDASSDSQTVAPKHAPDLSPKEREQTSKALDFITPRARLPKALAKAKMPEDLGFSLADVQAMATKQGSTLIHSDGDYVLTSPDGRVVRSSLADILSILRTQ